MKKFMISGKMAGYIASIWWVGFIPLFMLGWFWFPVTVPASIHPPAPDRSISTPARNPGPQLATLTPAPPARPEQPGLARTEPAIAPEPVSQPVAHARNAAVKSCLPAMQELSKLVVDGEHVAFSTWNREAANDHLFESIVGIKYANKTAPQGLSVLLAAPLRDEKCDGATVQVQPSQLPCDTIARKLTEAKLTVADLNGVRLIEASRSTRVVLLPTRGNGCAVVGIGIHYAK